MKRRPPVTDAQRIFFFGLGILAIALVAALLEYVDEPSKPEPCPELPYPVGERPVCVVEARP